MSKTQKRYTLNYRGTYFNGQGWGSFHGATLMTLSRANSIATAMNTQADVPYWVKVIDVTKLEKSERL